MPHIWKKIPSIRLFFPLILGIFIGNSIVIDSLSIIISFCILLIILFLGSFRLNRFYKYRWISGLLTLTIFTSFGIILIKIQDASIFKNHISNFSLTNKSKINARIINVSKYSKGQKLTVDIISIINQNNTSSPASGKMFLYIKDSLLLDNYIVGQQIETICKPFEIYPKKHPKDVDYKKIFFYKKITYQAFTKSSNTKIIRGSDNKVDAIAAKAKRKLKGIIKLYIPEEKPSSIIEALFLGTKNNLDKNTKSSITDAGVMHLFAVSGLHVGIIWMLITYIISFLNLKSILGKWPPIIIELITIWFFSLITGGHASVIRAVVMLSFIIVGKGISRDLNKFNILIFSAITLLIYNPYYLFQVGFLLSYTAVLGLFHIFPIINNSLYFKSKILDKIWSLISVNIAAWLITSPLIIFYFGKISSYSIISGLLTIPIVVMIINLLPFMFIAHFIFQPFANILGKIISFLTNILIQIIDSISNLPYSSINLNISSFPISLGIIFIIFIFFDLIKQRTKLKILVLIITVGFLVLLNTFMYLEKELYPKIIFSSINPNSVEISSNNYNRIVKLDSLGTYFIQFNDKKISILNGDKINIDSLSKADYLYITENTKHINTEIINKIKPTEIILSPNIPLKTISDWENRPLRKSKTYKLSKIGFLEI